jgi:hypothetical protein
MILHIHICTHAANPLVTFLQNTAVDLTSHNFFLFSMVNIIKTKIINIQDLKTPLMHTNRSLQKYYEMSGTTASTVGSQ